MTARPSSKPTVSANERFKSKSGDAPWLGLIAAVISHLGFFTLCPEVRAAETRVLDTPLVVVHRPPGVNIPSPPQQVDRPQAPRVAAAVVEDSPYRHIPPGRARQEAPPLPRPGVRPEDVPSYIPRDQEPVLRNRGELIQEMQRRYPAMLREAWIEGTVGVYLYVAETGKVTKSVLQRSSGQPAFDSVAVNLALDARFSPARRDESPVGVWILLPFRFSTR